MRKPVKIFALIATHAVAVALGIGLGIYLLPILIAPEGPAVEALQSAADDAQFSGVFHRDLADSDALHWGEGTLFVGKESIALEGRLAPGPDYRLYLSPEFVETEAAFAELKPQMVEVGLINTFDNFMISVPHSINPADYKAAIVWCESFGQFITATAYQ